MDHKKKLSYNDYNCPKSIIGVDNLLNRYQDDRMQVINLIKYNYKSLIEKIWKKDGILAIDENCRSNINNRNYYICTQCRNLRRLLDDRSGLNKPFSIKYGSMLGESLIIKNINTLKNNIFLRIDNYNNLNDNIDNKIIGDKFTINLLINWMLMDIFHNMNLNHCVNLYTSFICNNIGYNLEEYPDYIDITELSKKYYDKKDHKFQPALEIPIVKSIINQILIILDILSEYNFSFGSPSISSLYFKNEAISYSYKNKNICGPITLKLHKFYNCSIIFNKNFYHSLNLEKTLFLEQNIFNNKFLNIFEFKHIENKKFFKLNDESLEFFISKKGDQIINYTPQIDFYCLIVSLMTCNDFFNTIKNDESLNLFWNNLWCNNNQKQIVEYRLSNFHNDNNPPIIIKGKGLISDNNFINSLYIINDIWLNTNILHDTWHLL